MFSSPHFYLPTLYCILGDGRYTGSAFANRMLHLTGAKVAAAKRSELHRFAVMPKQWILERSFAWLVNAEGFGKIASKTSKPR